MKLIEKIAQEWWLKQRDLAISGGDPESYAPDPSSFIAGFKEGVEMSANKLCHRGTDPTGAGEDAIRNLFIEEAD